MKSFYPKLAQSTTQSVGHILFYIPLYFMVEVLLAGKYALRRFPDALLDLYTTAWNHQGENAITSEFLDDVTQGWRQGRARELNPPRRSSLAQRRKVKSDFFRRFLALIVP